MYRIKIYSIDLNTMILSEYLLAKGTNWDRKAIIKSLPIEAINKTLESKVSQHCVIPSNPLPSKLSGAAVLTHSGKQCHLLIKEC